MRAHTDWLLTPERAAIHLPTRTAVLSDLHLAYDEARRRAGEAVPLHGIDEVIATVGALVRVHDVSRLVLAGDFLEDGRLAASVVELLHWLDQESIALVGVVPGNHDRMLHAADMRLPHFADGMELGGWRIIHGDRPRPPGRVVQGHIHPCLRWDQKLCVPCYLIGAQHLVLPAFSLDAAGVNVLRTREWDDYRCAAIAGNEVLDLGKVSGLRKVRQGRKK
jgi:putative SbcD/Mre11-related phosphoesterase